MSEPDILKKVNILSNNNDETLYHFLSEQLNYESNNIEFWLSLAIAISYPPFGDEEKAIAFTRKALAIDSNNPIALIILAFMYEYHLGGIDDTLLHKIKNLHSGSNEINSMLKYVASWSYAWHKKNDPEMEEELLKESIELCGKHVWNYVALADLYSRQKRYLEINGLIKQALNNVKKIYTDKNLDEYTTTSINDFINSLIKGTHITDTNAQSIQERFICSNVNLI